MEEEEREKTFRYVTFDATVTKVRARTDDNDDDNDNMDDCACRTTARAG